MLFFIVNPIQDGSERGQKDAPPLPVSPCNLYKRMT